MSLNDKHFSTSFNIFSRGNTVMASCFNVTTYLCALFFKILFLFRERGREGEREGEKHQCVVASCVPPSGDLAHTLGMYPDWDSNLQPFDLQPALNPLSNTSQGCLPYSIDCKLWKGWAHLCVFLASFIEILLTCMYV